MHIDYISIVASFGLAAVQVIALTMVSLTVLIAVRQNNVVIETNAYRTIGGFILFCFVAVFIWLVLSFAEALGYTSRAQPDSFQKALTLAELLATLVYLSLLLMAEIHLYRYVRAKEK